MLICVTNRKLCKDNFLERLEKIAVSKPFAIMLREKDLSVKEYEILAKKIKNICSINGVSLIINQNIEVALKLNVKNIHLSMFAFKNNSYRLTEFNNVGVSIHSINDAIEAQKLGASYLVAGHIFPTDCKKGTPARGIEFLEKICNLVSIPVFAIGGITVDKIKEIKKTGASGVCIMSEAMTSVAPEKLCGNYLWGHFCTNCIYNKIYKIKQEKIN